MSSLKRKAPTAGTVEAGEVINHSEDITHGKYNQ